MSYARPMGHRGPGALPPPHFRGRQVGRPGFGQTCGAGEHYDWETGQCAPGLCPPGSTIGPSGNCEVDYGQQQQEDSTEPSSEPSSSGGSTRSARGGSYAPYPGSTQQASMLGSAAGAFVVAGVVIAAGIYYFGRSR